MNHGMFIGCTGIISLTIPSGCMYYGSLFCGSSIKTLYLNDYIKIDDFADGGDSLPSNQIEEIYINGCDDEYAVITGCPSLKTVFIDCDIGDASLFNYYGYSNGPACVGAVLGENYSGNNLSLEPVVKEVYIDNVELINQTYENNFPFACRSLEKVYIKSTYYDSTKSSFNLLEEGPKQFNYVSISDGYALYEYAGN